MRYSGEKFIVNRRIAGRFEKNRTSRLHRPKKEKEKGL